MHAQTVSIEDLPPSHLSLSKFPSEAESGDFHPGNFQYPSLNNFANSASGQTELSPAPGFPRQPLLPVEMTSGEKILPSPSVLQRDKFLSLQRLTGEVLVFPPSPFSPLVPDTHLIYINHLALSCGRETLSFFREETSGTPPPPPPPRLAPSQDGGKREE